MSWRPTKSYLKLKSLDIEVDKRTETNRINSIVVKSDVIGQFSEFLLKMSLVVALTS